MWVCAVEAALFFIASCIAASYGPPGFIAASVRLAPDSFLQNHFPNLIFVLIFQVFRLLGNVGLRI